MNASLFDEFENLSAAILDKSATAADVARFNQILSENLELCHIYFEQMEVHVLLECRLRSINTSAAHPKRRLGKAAYWLPPLAAAVLVAAGIGFWSWRGEKQENLTQTPRRTFEMEGERPREPIQVSGRSREKRMAEHPPISSDMGGSPMIPAEHPSLEPAIPAVAAAKRQPASGEQLVVSSGMGGSPMIPAPSPPSPLDPPSPSNEAASPPSTAALAAESTISAAGTVPDALAPEQPAAAIPQKEEKADMTAIQKLAAVTSAVALTGATQNLPNVTDVTLNQIEYTRKVRVTYKTDAPGIATCRFLNNGENISITGVVRTVKGDIHKYLPSSTGNNYSFTWDAGRDLPQNFFSNLTVEVTLWATNNPPLYCAVHLVEQDNSYRIRWYSDDDTVPFGVEAQQWKNDWLLLRKIHPTEGEDITLGSPSDEPGRAANAIQENERLASITQPFYIGTYQVTQRQWWRVNGDWPSAFSLECDRETRPVEKVSYNEIRGAKANGYNWPVGNKYAVAANSFMGILRTKTGETLNFDLPTEAQWEYACRAGTTGRWNVEGADISELARYNTNNGTIPADYDSSNVPAELGGTAKVGSYLPNSWHLYDMHGNVYEWCLDWYTTDVNQNYMRGENPTGPEDGDKRARRGGNWYNGSDMTRSAYRASYAPDRRESYFGFRIAIHLNFQ